MSKLLCTVASYRSSIWQEPSVESLLESPIEQLSWNLVTLNLNPTGSEENLQVQKEGTQV